MYEPYLRINLKNIADNCNELKAAAGKPLCAVVKADAYRHGAAAVAGALEGRCSMFAVATANEAVSLRLAGITGDILTLAPVGGPYEAERLINYGVILTLSGYSSISAVSLAAKAAGTTARAHIKLNTGMNRYGFSKGDILGGGLFKALAGADDIAVEGIYSHFYNVSSSTVTEGQFNLFSSLSERVQDKLNTRLIRHIAATGGVAVGGERYALDMVRCGLGLYGYSPVKTDLKLKAAMECFAPVAERRIYEFGGAGYGADYVGPSKEFSTLRFGYADGLAFLNGLCMDGAVVTKRINGNEVRVLSSAADIAKANEISVYKVLCSFSERVDKRYIYD